MKTFDERKQFKGDEVGKPIWKLPEEIEGDDKDIPDVEDEEEDFEIHPVPPSGEEGIHVPPFDPEQQRDWEERERIRREEEAQREERENPRGVWEMD